MKKKSKGTAAGREIIAALTELRDTLAAGIPLGEKYTVRHVVAPEPGAYDERSVEATGVLRGHERVELTIVPGETK